MSAEPLIDEVRTHVGFSFVLCDHCGKSIDLQDSHTIFFSNFAGERKPRRYSHRLCSENLTKQEIAGGFLPVDLEHIPATGLKNEVFRAMHATLYMGGHIGGLASHPQVLMPQGFTCDEQMVPFVEALWRKGLRSLGCCQNSNQSGRPAWVVPRREISYEHGKVNQLLGFCLHIRTCLLDKAGWNQNMTIDSYFTPSDPFASLSFGLAIDADVLAAIDSFEQQE